MTLNDFIPSFDSENIITWVFFTFSAFACIQLLYTLLIYGRLAFHKHNNDGNESTPPVSIVIAARNESKNLSKYLPFILEQDYPVFEVIIVNHQSIDDSKYILKAYEVQYPNLHVIHIERTQHMPYGKKFPLTIGIKGAKYEHLLLTDADCKPSSNQWLKSMSSHFTDKKGIVLGYGPYEKRKGFLNKLVRFDAAWIALSYLSMAKAGMPYMGIGRNMAYTKTIFESVNGFKSHYGLPSGDDDLFIQEAAMQNNYTINIDQQAICISKPANSLSQWIQQKSRHYTTSNRYGVFKKLMLGIYPLSLLIMYGTFVSLLTEQEYRWISVVIFTLLLFTKWIIIGRAFRKLQEKSFVPWIPFWDFLNAIWTPVLFYTVDKRDTNKW